MLKKMDHLQNLQLHHIIKQEPQASNHRCSYLWTAHAAPRKKHYPMSNWYNLN